MSIQDTVSTATSELVADAYAHQARVGIGNATDVTSASDELALWVQYFRSSSEGALAEELLEGVQAALLEAVAYTSLGLLRASVHAMRLQIELLLAYTYFREHPAEWRRVCTTGDGFMMFGAVQSYHAEQDAGLKRRLQMIEAATGLRLARVYRLLSAHVHAQSPLTVPRHGGLRQLVADDRLSGQLPEMQRRTTEALSNYLCAVYVSRWPELPSGVVHRINDALSPRNREAFFSPAMPD